MKIKILGTRGETMPDLISLFKYHTKNIVFIHFGPWFYDDTKDARKKIASMGKEAGINAIAGYEGMEIDIEEMMNDE